MNRTTIRAVRDQYDRDMFRLPDLNSYRDDGMNYSNGILTIFKYENEEEKPSNGYNSLVMANTENVLIPNISNKLAKGYTYIFRSIITKDVDPKLVYQYDTNMILHSIKGCDDDGFLWCERMPCVELYKLVGKDLYNSILENEVKYGKVYRF